MGSTRRTRIPLNGDQSFVRVCFQKTAPVTVTAGVTVLNTQTVTVGASPALAGEQTITVTALTHKIEAGNWLLFSSPVGEEFLAQVVADAAAAATSLSVAPLEFDIPTASTAQWPPEVLDRTESPWESSAETQDFRTYNTGGGRVVKAMSLTESWTANGFYTHRNAGLKIIDSAFRDKKEFWYILELPPENGYSKGEIRVGLAVCDSAPTSVSAESEVGAERGGQITGSPYFIPPVPIAA